MLRCERWAPGNIRGSRARVISAWWKVAFSGPACVLSIGLAACGPAPVPAKPSPPPAPVESSARAEPPQPVEPPIRQPFVGAQRSVDGPALPGETVTRGTFGDHVVLGLELPEDWQHRALEAVGDSGPGESSGSTPVLEADVVDPVADVVFFLPSDVDASSKRSSQLSTPRARIWVLTSQDRVGQLAPVLWVSFSDRPEVPVVKLPIAVHTENPETVTDAYGQWGRALARFFRREQPTPLRQFALYRLAERFERPTALAGVPRPVTGRPGLAGLPVADPVESRPHSELDDLMSLGSGQRSIERALEHRQRLKPNDRVWRPRINVAKLTPPEVRRHDWATMLGGLSGTAPVPEISHAVPADFYLVHATSGKALFAALDELDDFVTPAVHLLEGRARRYALAERYQTELGVPRTLLSRAFGPEVIDELALVGSDPFLRLGSDLTLLFRPRHLELLEQGLKTALQQAAAGHGELQERELQLASNAVTLSRTPHDEVHRFMTLAGGYVVLSNSRAALEKVLQTLAGKAPSLAGEPDFQYMLGRDAGVEADVLMYAGDAFIQKNVSPGTRILDARRGIAAGELARVGYAALLHSMFGAPLDADLELLMKANLLTRSEARHFDGAAISGDRLGPRSRWGTPGHMTPLIDLGPLKYVTAAEQEAYERFRSRYELAWGDKIDPIALRLKLAQGGKGFVSHLRVLPLVRDRDYSDVLGLAGDSHLALTEPALGARMALALADHSSLKNSGAQLSKLILGRRGNLDWLGDYVFVGVEDRSAAANALFARFAPDPSAESGDWLVELSRLPLYAGIHLRSVSLARVVLGALKNWGKSKMDLSWKQREDYLDYHVYEVAFSDDVKLSLFYAIAGDVLFISTQLQTLHHLLDRGDDPGIKSDPAGQAQFALETHQDPGGGLCTLLNWLFERADSDQFEALAWARALGKAISGEPGAAAPTAPSARRAALAFLGQYPVTRDGLPFRYSEIGAEDPARGNELLRRWPSLPVVGSEAAAVLGKLCFARFELSFEQEAADAEGRRERSLGVRAAIER